MLVPSAENIVMADGDDKHVSLVAFLYLASPGLYRVALNDACFSAWVTSSVAVDGFIYRFLRPSWMHMCTFAGLGAMTASDMTFIHPGNDVGGFSESPWFE